MSDANSIQADVSGVDTNGDPVRGGNGSLYRIICSRFDQGPDAIVGNPDKQEWSSVHNGVEYAGHFDAFEQIVPIGDQISWKHEFSDGIVRDPRFILHELMEFAIQWRKANGLPTTAYPGAKQPPA
ncbi:hypothetical protein [Mycobacterium malmoense]|uniref:hypothetical protein n=1 Tax=Mycobacterium malmoense TaxID=1780 RepID=UPI0008F94F5C|nr:hypothetical protein [Mycobacterium malmoense]OIN79782.1 hypothetical protein BMG05_16685 [Mycobacterium malmoense]